MSRYAGWSIKKRLSSNPFLMSRRAYFPQLVIECKVPSAGRADPSEASYEPEDAIRLPFAG
jgi:hypothetical protein